MSNYLFGVCVSLFGHSISALGINLQRYAHTLQTNTPLYKRQPWVWGLVCLGSCEIINFIALSLAPASVVAPLGSFSVVCSAFFGSLIFGERVGPDAVTSIIFIVIGAFITVYNGPPNSKDLSVEEFKIIIQSPKTSFYILFLLIIMILLGILGKNNPFSSIALASLSAGNTITLTKALSMFVKMSLTSENQLNSIFPYMIFIFILLSVILQLKCINKAMEKYKSFVVSAFYFVMLTTMTIINATILFGEMISLKNNTLVLFICGCLCVMIGVWILTKETSKNKEEEQILLHDQRNEI